MRRVRIGVDVGGTFTDIVLTLPGGRVVVNKTSTTPDDPGRGVLAGIDAALRAADIDAADVAEIVHGTTVASNTILQKSGARTGLLTTAGFRDVLEIGRIRTPGMFDLAWRKPAPLVPRRWRREVFGRVAADGTVVTPLDAEGVVAAARFFVAEEIEAAAICFLNSYVNPVHEREAVGIFRDAAPDILLSASCDVLPEIKEYERTSTAVVNAYLLPAMRTYLARLSQHLAERGISAPVQVMTSNGGMVGLAAAGERPVFAVGSGPAGGVTGAAHLARSLGENNLIVFDMGGTTAKASLVEDGRPALVTEYEFRDGISSPSRFIKGGGYMLKVPAIDIAEVGSGGGSLARIDEGGLLVVGPESAGGDPGPACYGLGNQRPTVTDANVVLGLLNPHSLAGGSLKIDPALAWQAIERHIARPLGISVRRAAHGIRAVANAGMARAIRAVTVERGRDPRDIALMAFGGGGPVHAVDVARALDIRKVIISPAAGVFSAAGMLAADVEHDLVRALLAPLDAVAVETMQTALGELRDQGLRELASEGYGESDVLLRFAADLHYAGQSCELTVDFPEGVFDRDRLRVAFEDRYLETFHYRADEAVELVNLRLTAAGISSERLDFGALGLDAVANEGISGTRQIWLGDDPVEARLLPRGAITATGIDGPAIIESYDTTIVLPPGCHARAGDAGIILIDWKNPDA